MDKKKKTVIVVEDDQNISDLIKLYCEKEGFRVICVADGEKGLEFVRTIKPDCLILDWMLPGMDGIEVLRSLRDFSTVPVLMVTARCEEFDKVIGLELGADDYITKPFSPKELMARVKAILRRIDMSSDHNAEENLLLSDLEIDFSRMQVKQAGKSLNLSVLEFKLLSILASLPGKVFSREQLMEKIYDSAALVFDRTIDVHIKNLRKKLGDSPKAARYIESVFGVGYKFKEDEN